MINDTTLYTLKNKSVIQITTSTASTKINISNGYHYIPSFTATQNYKEPIGYKIETYLDNVRMGYLVFLTILLFTIAWTIDSLLAQILANIPLLAVCLFVLISKKNILYLKPLDYQPQSCRG